MRQRTLLWLTIFLVCLSGSVSFGQSETSSAIRDFLRGFRSNDWTQRRVAFYGLLESLAARTRVSTDKLVSGNLASILGAVPEDGTEITVSLSELLSKENTFVLEHQFVPQEFADYYGDLVWAVSSLRDVRTSEALLGAIGTGEMATSTLAGFGPAVLDTVLGKLTSADVVIKNAATRVLSAMLDRENVQKFNDEYNMSRIRSALVRSASDDYPYVRISAIEGLAKIRDAEAISIIRKLADGDDYDASTHGGSKGVYPVRETAQEILSQLKTAR